MEKRATASISTEYVDMPTDLIELVNIQLNTTSQSKLTFYTPGQMDKFKPSQTTGQPKYYTIIGTEFQFKPVPDATYTAELAYIARFAAFSGDSDTNWLLTNHPDVYLFGALVAAGPYVSDEKLTTWAAIYQNAIESLNDMDKNASHSGGILQRTGSTTE